MSNLVSNCCGASPWFDETDLCSRCLEHADFEDLDEIWPTVSQQELDHQIASKLFITCNVPKFGLGAARKQMMQQGLPSHQIFRVTQILKNFINV
jgi:hypothetical protein